MDTMNIILCLLIAVLFIDRWLGQRRNDKLQDRLNRALIAKTVPEYEYTNKGELKKLKVENDLAIKAQAIMDAQEEKNGPHFPVT